MNNHNFDVNDAKVACRMLGYQSGEISWSTSSNVHSDPQPIWMTNLQCKGWEAHLGECAFGSVGDDINEGRSRHGQDISVRCQKGRLCVSKLFCYAFERIIYNRNV